MTKIDRRTLLKSVGTTAAVMLASGRSVVHADDGVRKAASAAAVERSKTISEQIAAYVRNARFEDLPAAVVAKAKSHIAYHFALAFDGHFTERADRMRRLSLQMHQSEGGATVIGESFRLMPSDAAYANAVLISATLRDDVLFPAEIHPGVVTLPPGLAMGELKASSGRDLILAMVLGYEVQGKLGAAGYGWDALAPRRGHQMYGGYGPMTTVGRLLRFDQKTMENAMGYAAHLSTGLPQGDMDDWYGMICRNGTFAAQIVEAGGSAHSNIMIEGPMGLYRSYFSEVPANLQSLIDSLGVDWETLRAEYKPYPGTGRNTAAIELMLRLVKEHRLEPSQVTKIDVFLTTQVAGRKEITFRGPFASHRESYRSLPYSLTISLVDGAAKPERHTMEHLRDPALNAIVQKVNITFEDGHDVARYCRIEIQTTDGRKIVGETDRAQLQFPPEQWGRMLQENGKRVLTMEQLQRLERMLNDLENLDDVSKLMATVRPGKSNARSSG